MAKKESFPSQPIREAKQSRSRILMQSVREATLALVAEHGVEAVTTVKVAERAGISPGSLYRYYPNKQAIFTDIYNSLLAEMDNKLADQAFTKNNDLEDTLRKTTDLTLRFYRELMSLHGSFFSAYYQQFDFTQRKNPSNQQTWEDNGRLWFIGLLEQHKHRLRLTDIEGTAEFLFYLNTGYFHRIIAQDSDKLNDDAVVDRLMDMMLRYLLHD